MRPPDRQARPAALDAARRATTPRLPLRGADGRRIGSVAAAHLPVLASLASLDDAADAAAALHLAADAVVLRDREPDACSATLHRLNAALRRHGLIPGWRDELFTVRDPATGAPLARCERAAMRFWGLLTEGAHANGYVAGPDGRPARLWIAQRALTKPTDPGRLDNLVGGGVPEGQTPHEALVREGFEEAGLAPHEMAAAVPAGVLRLARDVPEGFQLEDLHAFDLPLPAGRVPVNQDGEVAGFRLLPLDEALALACGDAMTVDAALVTLDFGVRHGRLPAAWAGHLQALRP